MEHDDQERPIEEHPVGSDNTGRGLLFGGGVALGAVLLALVWLLVSLIDSDPAPTSATAQLDGAVPTSTAPTAPAAAAPPSRGERCLHASDTLRAPLRAAQPAMDQWEVHVGAMNKLVVGAISLQQATAFWNQTRIGAERRIAEFRRSMRAVGRDGVDCPAPGRLPRTASPALRACVHRVDAEVRAVRAAKTAIGTWSMHVLDMERLRTGKLSAYQAGDMWVELWQRGQQELTAYRGAVRDTHKAGSCDGPSTAEPSQATSPSPAASPSMSMPGMG
jgi:hypothetical protein